MRSIAGTAVVLLSLGALSISPSCVQARAAAAEADSTTTYVGGDLEGRLEASPQRVVQACEAALKEMDIKVVSADATGIDGQVIGRSALDRKVEINAKREGEGSCRITIRVDMFGDEA